MSIVTFENFKQRSIDKHGDIFKFDGNNFVNMKTPFKYWCKEHDHLQERTPEQTLRLRNGCTECYCKIKNTDDFIKASMLIHKNKFDYSLCNYINTNTKVELICNDCGDHVFQTPSNNLMGKSCYSCSNLKPITKEEFIKRSNNKFNFKFNYDNIDYINVTTQIEFICPEHGLIQMVPRDHMNSKYGCALCAIDANANVNRMTKEEFISKSIELHGDAFIYDKVEYVNAHTSVLIGCHDLSHGYFLTKPTNHLNTVTGKCPKCPANNRKKRTTEEFIVLASEIHKNLYDYSETIYINEQTKIIVICPKGHRFTVTPNNHMRGKGCGVCKSSKGELEIMHYLNNNKINYSREFRIEECKNIKPLPFDFAVLNDDGSVKFLIEFQGQQHFIPVKFSGISDETALLNLNELQKRDKIKSEYCFTNGIPLLLIHHSDKDNIRTILSQFIRSLDDVLECL